MDLIMIKRLCKCISLDHS